MEKWFAAKNEAQAYLDLLFDENGNATAENVAANQEKADAYYNAFRYASLMPKSDVETCRVCVRNIQKLAELYNMTENNGKYTDESWAAFEAARKAALDYAAEHPVSENDTTGTDLKEYKNLNLAFVKAIYALQSTSENVTVTFSFTDDFHWRKPNLKNPFASWTKDPAGNTPQRLTVTLNSGAKLSDLFSETGYKAGTGNIYQIGSSKWETLFNGIYLNSSIASGWVDTNTYVLKDGDDIQFAHIEWPTFIYNVIYRDEVSFADMTDVLGRLRIKEDGAQSVEAGASLTLTVERTSAHPWSYNGVYSPYEGATIAAYGPMQEDGSYPQLLCLPMLQQPQTAQQALNSIAKANT